MNAANQGLKQFARVMRILPIAVGSSMEMADGIQSTARVPRLKRNSKHKMLARKASGRKTLRPLLLPAAGRQVLSRPPHPQPHCLNAKVRLRPKGGAGGARSRGAWYPSGRQSAPNFGPLRTRSVLRTRLENDVERRLCRAPEARKPAALDQNLPETPLACLGS